MLYLFLLSTEFQYFQVLVSGNQGKNNLPQYATKVLRKTELAQFLHFAANIRMQSKFHRFIENISISLLPI